MKRATRLILPLLAATMLASCGSSPETLLAQAEKSFAAQDFAAARVDLIEALRKDPTNRKLLTLLVQTQLRMRDGEGAQATVERLRAAGASGPEVVRYAAEAALFAGQPKDALEALGNDNAPDAWRIRAAAHMALENTDAALDAFRRGMAAGRDYRLTLDYGRFLLGSEDFAGAQTQLQSLQQMQPDGFDTLLFAGDLAMRTQRNDQSQAAYRRAAQLYPKRIEPLLGEANLLDGMGKIKEAMALAEKAAQLAPDDAAPRSLQVQLWAETGEWDKVRKALESREADLDPQSADGLTYGEAMLRLGHPEQARSIFSRALSLSPGNPYSRLMLAQAQLETGDAATAYQTIKPLSDAITAGKTELEIAEKAARASGSPDANGLRARLQSASTRDAQALAQRGNAAMARQDWNTAISAYQGLLALGKDAEILKRLALAQSNAGLGDQAIVSADQALAMAPENPDMAHMAGLVRYKAQRDLPRAVELLRQAVAGDRNNQLFKDSLAKASAAAG